MTIISPDVGLIYILLTDKCIDLSTSSPSSKYEHRRASALLRNIQNIWKLYGKKTYSFCNYENERISIKNSLPYLKRVLRLSYVVHGPMDFYVNRFLSLYMGFYVNGFLSI